MHYALCEEQCASTGIGLVARQVPCVSAIRGSEGYFRWLLVINCLLYELGGLGGSEECARQSTKWWLSLVSMKVRRSAVAGREKRRADGECLSLGEHRTAMIPNTSYITHHANATRSGPRNQSPNEYLNRDSL